MAISLKVLMTGRGRTRRDEYSTLPAYLQYLAPAGALWKMGKARANRDVIHVFFWFLPLSSFPWRNRLSRSDCRTQVQWGSMHQPASSQREIRSIPLLLRLHCYLCSAGLLLRATRRDLVASLRIWNWTRAPFLAPLVTRHR